MDAALAEFFEHAESLHRARDEERFLDERRKLDRFLVDGGIQQILGVDDAEEIVEASVADGENRVRALLD